MFAASVLSVIISSYLLLSALDRGGKKAANPGFLYFLLISFAQIVLSFEILSLLKAVSKTGFLTANALFLTASAVIFIKYGIKRHCEPANAGAAIQNIPLWILTALKSLRMTLKEILNALKRDKALKFLSVCFILFLIFQLITVIFFPVTAGDALSYYLPRCTAWLQNGSISHYITPDTRELIMPVNMEFLYTWLLLFTKSENGAGIFSYTGFLAAVYVIYSLLKELNFTVKRRLWAVFAFSSFSLASAEMTEPCFDLFTGALILSAVYLFIKASKYDDKTALYFSALSYALACGTKTTALIAAPSVFIIFCAVSYIYKKNYMPPSQSLPLEGGGQGGGDKNTGIAVLIKFCLFFALNFAIFSGYNYILNFIQFSNPLSSNEQLLLHQFRGGIKGYITNFIKYCFAFFDMSGMPYLNSLSAEFSKLQPEIFEAAGLNINDGASAYFPKIFISGKNTGLLNSFLGAMGLFAFIPCLIYSAIRFFKKIKVIIYNVTEKFKNIRLCGSLRIKPCGVLNFKNFLTSFFGKKIQKLCPRMISSEGNLGQLLTVTLYIKNPKYFITGILGFSVLLNMLILSGSIVFMSFNIRFLFTFIVIAAPVLSFSYYAKPNIYKIFLCAVMFIYLFLIPHQKPVSYIFSCIKEKRLIKLEIPCSEKAVYNYFKDKKPCRISILLNSHLEPVFYIEKLRLDNFEINEIILEETKKPDLSKTDYIITYKDKSKINAAYTANFKERIKNPAPEKSDYVSKCTYFDKNNNMTDNINAEPAVSKCEIPFSYFKDSGFIKAEDTGKYIILKRAEF